MFGLLRSSIAPERVMCLAFRTGIETPTPGNAFEGQALNVASSDMQPSVINTES